MNLPLLEIDLLPKKQVRFLAPQAGPQAQEKREIVLGLRLPQFASGACEQPFRVHFRMVTLRAGVFQLHPLKRVGGDFDFQEAQHVVREERAGAAQVGGCRSLRRFPFDRVHAGFAHVLVAPRIDRLRREHVERLAIDFGEPGLAAPVHVVVFRPPRLASQTRLQFGHVGNHLAQLYRVAAHGHRASGGSGLERRREIRRPCRPRPSQPELGLYLASVASQPAETSDR